MEDTDEENLDPVSPFKCGVRLTNGDVKDIRRKKNSKRISETFSVDEIFFQFFLKLVLNIIFGK